MLYLCDHQPAVVFLAGKRREEIKMADTEGSQNSQKSSQFSQSDLPELLNQYYKRLFPYKYFVQWLSYGGGKDIHGSIRSEVDLKIIQRSYNLSLNLFVVLWAVLIP